MLGYRKGAIAATFCLAAAAIILALVLLLQRQDRPQALIVRHAQPDLSVQWHVGPNGQPQPYAGVTMVTWYGADGLSKVFTNTNAAVPFPGAPARRG